MAKRNASSQPLPETVPLSAASRARWKEGVHILLRLTLDTLILMCLLFLFLPFVTKMWSLPVHFNSNLVGLTLSLPKSTWAKATLLTPSTAISC